MSESITHTFDLITSIPMDAQDPIGGFAVVASAAALAYLGKRKFEHTEEARFTQISSAAQLEKSVVDERDERRRKGLIPTYLLIGGASLLLSNVVAQPKTETNVKASGTNVVLVQSMTNSMLHTYDLGNPQVSREDAVVQGLESSHYTGRMGIIQPEGDPTIPEDTPQIIFPLTANWRKISEIKTSQVNPNDGYIGPAIQTAAGELPTVTVKKGATKKNGEVIVISDGLIDDNPNDIAGVASSLKKEGVKIQFIVPGTLNNNATYKYNGASTPTPSAEQMQNFAAFGSTNIEQPETVAAVKQDIDSDLSSAEMTKKKENSYLLLFLGALSTLDGLILDVRQRIRRYI